MEETVFEENHYFNPVDLSREHEISLRYCVGTLRVTVIWQSAYGFDNIRTRRHFYNEVTLHRATWEITTRRTTASIIRLTRSNIVYNGSVP